MGRQVTSGSTRIRWRRTLYALWAAQILTIIGFSLRMPFLPFFLGDLGATEFEEQALWAGIIAGGGSAVMAFTSPLWGYAADRYGRRLMVLRAMFAGSITISLMALATAPWHLLALRFIEGAMTGTVAASITLIATVVPKDQLGYSLGLMQTAIFSGSSIGPLIGGFMAQVIGFRASFVVAGSMLFMGGWIVYFLVEENFKRPPQQSEAEKRKQTSTWAILLGSAMLAVIMVQLMGRMGNSAIQPLAPLHVEQLGAGAAATSLSGIALGAMGITSAVSSLLLGRVADRIGQRTILLITAACSGLLYFPLAAAQTPVQFIICMGLLGIAVGGMLPSANALIAQLTPPDRRGVIYGFANAATAFGGFLGPVGGAAIAAAISIRAMLITLGGLSLVTALYIWKAIPKNIDDDDRLTANTPIDVEPD